ncbi:inositol phosphate kinase 2 isoform X1 [Halictus rubicundus]|uniref:inositol phosphate kinase 2 isoform X1 n=2 Tax=Halictus rubicundus TaxID=77578 RepID=UPI0040366F84
MRVREQKGIIEEVNYCVPHGAITMTTLDSQSDKTLCHLDKVPSTEFAEISSDCGFHDTISLLETQVAGHPSNDKRRTIGMLRRPDGRVLKPVVKPMLGKREIAFYENLEESEDPVMLQLKNFVPKYYGTTELQIFGKRVTFLTLKDIIDGMAEPCVMDIKIGRRTWDPLATPQKRATEELKYAESKRTYGFCITGFQVYCLPSGQLKKFGKHYGKTLDAKGVVEALKLFLNISPERPPCRQLIVQLLSFLWKILLFFRTQRLFRFYSSSLLVAYDAKRLRHYLHPNNLNTTDRTTPTSHVTNSFSTASDDATATSRNAFKEASEGTRDSGTSQTVETDRNQTAERVHCIKRSISLSSECESTGKEKAMNRSGSCSSDFRADRLCRTHSYGNNYDDDIIQMKKDYDALLSELSSSSEEKLNWVRINMIDFTHVFPTEDRNTLDVNYLEGIENLIKLVEMFLTSKDNAA